MKISTGKVKSAQKLVLYAPEGFGKSTFASQFPDPIYIDTEGSTKQLDVRRFDADMSSWDNIIEAVSYVADGNADCSTLVIDTIDWAEQSCIDKLNKVHNTANILTMDFGRGSLFVVAEFRQLIDKLDEVVKRGINVVLLAHAAMRKQELPEEMGAFDHWELKLQSKQVKSMVKEWADLLIFGNFKTYIVTDEKTKSKKAQGNKRVLYTEHHACWDAKNRHGLEAEIPFEYKSIAHLFSGTEKVPEKAPEKAPEKKTATKKKEKPAEEPAAEAVPFPSPLSELLKLMEESKVTEDQVLVTFHAKGKFMEAKKLSDITDMAFIEKSVIGNWDSFRKAVERYGKEVPFIAD